MTSEIRMLQPPQILRDSVYLNQRDIVCCELIHDSSRMTGKTDATTATSLGRLENVHITEDEKTALASLTRLGEEIVRFDKETNVVEVAKFNRDNERQRKNATNLLFREVEEKSSRNTTLFVDPKTSSLPSLQNDLDENQMLKRRKVMQLFSPQFSNCPGDNGVYYFTSGAERSPSPHTSDALLQRRWSNGPECPIPNIHSSATKDQVNVKNSPSQEVKSSSFARMGSILSHRDKFISEICDARPTLYSGLYPDAFNKTKKIGLNWKFRTGETVQASNPAHFQASNPAHFQMPHILGETQISTDTERMMNEVGKQYFGTNRTEKNSVQSTNITSEFNYKLQRKSALNECTKQDKTQKKCVDRFNKKKCAIIGCTKFSQTGGKCVFHGGGTRCSEVGCSKYALVKGKCHGHGSRKVCPEAGCIKYTQLGGKCFAHGGGRRCSEAGCEKHAKVRGKCVSHGGGKRCLEAGCTKSAQGGGKCVSHGGGKRCCIKGCAKSAKEGGKCIAHGGGKKCSIPGCTKSVQIERKCIAIIKSPNLFK